MKFTFLDLHKQLVLEQTQKNLPDRFQVYKYKLVQHVAEDWNTGSVGKPEWHNQIFCSLGVLNTIFHSSSPSYR